MLCGRARLLSLRRNLVVWVWLVGCCVFLVFVFFILVILSPLQFIAPILPWLRLVKDFVCGESCTLLVSLALFSPLALVEWLILCIVVHVDLSVVEELLLMCISIYCEFN